MYVPYNTLPENARIWIHQSNRAFTEEEQKLLEEKSHAFIDEWTRHGKALKASFTVVYRQFFVLAVDESFAEASGCSIDASVRFVQRMEALFSLDLLDKLNVAFRRGTSIHTVDLATFQELAMSKQVSLETIVFNNMVTTKGDFETHWEVPAKNSWHRRFLPQS